MISSKQKSLESSLKHSTLKFSDYKFSDYQVVNPVLFALRSKANENVSKPDIVKLDSQIEELMASDKAKDHYSDIEDDPIFFKPSKLFD